MTEASRGVARGWEEVTSEGMGKNGYQVVMYRLNQIKNDIGDGHALDHCKSLRGQDKVVLP